MSTPKLWRSTRPWASRFCCAPAEGVVADQPPPRGGGAARDAGHHAGGGVQVRRTEMQVGLQIGPFAPFVPGVDADNRLAEESVPGRDVAEAAQPVFVLGRGRTQGIRAWNLLDIPAGACAARA